jgi:hypothetical protein
MALNSQGSTNLALATCSANLEAAPLSTFMT